jgi:hypothetical protein
MSSSVSSQGIFISYRRHDASGYATTLYDYLRDRYEKEQIFFDIDSISAGSDFVEALEIGLSQSRVLLAVIGRSWLTAVDDNGKRRIDDPGDYVRLEIEAALSRGIPVVPVLVDGAALPQVSDLPESLRPLARRQNREIRHAGSAADMAALVRVISSILGSSNELADLSSQRESPITVSSSGKSQWSATLIKARRKVRILQINLSETHYLKIQIWADDSDEIRLDGQVLPGSDVAEGDYELEIRDKDAIVSGILVVTVKDNDIFPKISKLSLWVEGNILYTNEWRFGARRNNLAILRGSET